MIAVGHECGKCRKFRDGLFPFIPEFLHRHGRVDLQIVVYQKVYVNATKNHRRGTLSGFVGIFPRQRFQPVLASRIIRFLGLLCHLCRPATFHISR